MRIAIPIWGDKVSPVLDTASRLLIVEIEGQTETSRFEAYPGKRDLWKRCVFIQDMGVDVLICGAVSLPFVNILEACDISVIPDISGRPEEVLKAYIEGNLLISKFMMPGCQHKRFARKTGRVFPETTRIQFIKRCKQKGKIK